MAVLEAGATRVHGCLCIRCEGVDLRIETPHYVAKLSEQMGQLESLTPKVAPGRPAVVDAWQRPR